MMREGMWRHNMVVLKELRTVCVCGARVFLHVCVCGSGTPACFSIFWLSGAPRSQAGEQRGHIRGSSRAAPPPPSSSATPSFQPLSPPSSHDSQAVTGWGGPSWRGGKGRQQKAGQRRRWRPHSHVNVFKDPFFIFFRKLPHSICINK